jgi:hypothetical protein
MLVASRIQDTWLEMLRQASQLGEVQVRKLEEGYYAVVLPGVPGAGQNPLTTSPDYQALQSSIPHLDRTRAVYLTSSSDYHLSDIESLRDWAGELATDIETGTRHAFAVVNAETFRRRVETELSSAGWAVEVHGQGLKVSDGRFVEQVNLLLAVVRMVLSRSNMAGTTRWVAQEVRGQFARDAQFFLDFQSRFEKLAPGIIDHYFVAYSEASCVATGRDYWELAGKNAAESEQVFAQAMIELETFLQAPPEDWLPAFLARSCQSSSHEN